MNKVILLGRLTRDPEVRCAQDGLTITRYSLAVNRRVKRQGEAEADFIDCVAFGKAGEFAGNYFHKGQLVAVVGRLQIRDWQNKDGNRRRSAEVVVEEQYFAEAKREGVQADNARGLGAYAARPASASQPPVQQTLPTDTMAPSGGVSWGTEADGEDDDLPF